MAHSVATPALLCHKEPAQGTQSPLSFRTKCPLLGTFLAFRWVCLYGIRIGCEGLDQLYAGIFLAALYEEQSEVYPLISDD